MRVPHVGDLFSAQAHVSDQISMSSDFPRPPSAFRRPPRYSAFRLTKPRYPHRAMRWSQAFIPTLRDNPAEAEAISHRLLVRGGFIRQLSAGHYSMLPLGQRVRAKIERIIREEMDAIGGQEFHLPAIHPAEMWKKSGRWEVMGDELFRLKDRRGVDNALGMTHEEVFATLATEISSYRDLPQIW